MPAPQKTKAEESLARDLGQLFALNLNLNSEVGQQKIVIRSVLNSLTVPLFIVQNGDEIVHMSRRAKKILEFAEISSDHVRSFTHTAAKLLMNSPHKDLDSLKDLIKRVTESQFIADSIQVEINSPNKRYFEIKTSPIYSDDLGDLGRIWLFVDITESKNIEEMKTEFLSIASHQLRTPLTSIRGYTDMLLSGDYGDVPPSLTEALHAIEKAGKQMSDLLDDLLNLSRLEKRGVTISKSRFSVNELISEIKQEIEPLILAKSQILTISNQADDSAELETDRGKLREALLNLLNNANKYSPKNSEITLDITKPTTEALRFTISDKGIGIPELQKDKIFTKFYRAANVLTENFEGTGLGLYYVKKIAGMLGGRVGFESEQNKGSQFHIEIPNPK